MEFENSLVSKASKKNKKRKNTANLERKIEQEPSETELEPVALKNSPKKNKKKRKSKSKEDEVELQEYEPKPESPVKNATPKFGRSKGEVNNNICSPSKSDKEVSDSSFASPKEPQKKKRKSCSNDTMSSDFDSTANSDFQSPSKKLKFDDGDIIEESKKLLSVVAEQLTPESTPYDKRLTTLDYDKISENFPNRSAEDCKHQLRILIEGTVKKKCLHQILTEALEEVHKEKTLARSFNNFFYLKADEINEELYKRDGQSSRLSIAAELWGKLKATQKQAYQPEYNQKSKASGQTPFELFCSHLKKKDKNIKPLQARQEWHKLSDEKKIKFIRRSLKRMMNEEELKEDEKRLKHEQNQESDEDESPEKKIKGPSKDEIALFLKHLEYPEEPTKFLPLFYYNKKKKSSEADGKPQNRLLISQKIFRELSKEKQEEWTEKHQKYLAACEKKLEEWKAKQDNITLFAMKKDKMGKLKTKVMKKNEKSEKPERKIIKKNALQDYINKLEVTEISCGIPKFQDEPGIPPLTPFKLYSNELEKKKGDEKLTYNQIKESYGHLSKTDKIAYEAKCETIKEIYIKGLKDYVRDMSEDQRRLFLGVRRVKYIKALGHDIFEEDYPNSKFKIYEKVKKGSGVSKPKKTESAPAEEEVSIEEVEDMEDFEIPKAVEHKSHSPGKKKDKKKLASSQVSDDDDDEDDDDDDDYGNHLNGLESFAY